MWKQEKIVNDDMWVAVYDDIKVIYHYQTDTNTVGHFMFAGTAGILYRACWNIHNLQK